MSYRHYASKYQVLLLRYLEKEIIFSNFFIFQCVYQSPDSRMNENGVGAGWAKGAYMCKCRQGFYSPSHHRAGFDGILVEGQDQLLLVYEL